MADVITKVANDGKEHVIIKKAYKDFDEEEAEIEQLDCKDIASKCVRDWRDFFDDKSKKET